METCPKCGGSEIVETDEYNGDIYYECAECGCAWSSKDGYFDKIFYEGY